MLINSYFRGLKASFKHFRLHIRGFLWKEKILEKKNFPSQKWPYRENPISKVAKAQNPVQNQRIYKLGGLK